MAWLNVSWLKKCQEFPDIIISLLQNKILFVLILLDLIFEEEEQLERLLNIIKLQYLRRRKREISININNKQNAKLSQILKLTN